MTFGECRLFFFFKLSTSSGVLKKVFIQKERFQNYLKRSGILSSGPGTTSWNSRNSRKLVWPVSQEQAEGQPKTVGNTLAWVPERLEIETWLCRWLNSELGEVIYFFRVSTSSSVKCIPFRVTVESQWQWMEKNMALLRLRVSAPSVLTMMIVIFITTLLFIPELKVNTVLPRR